MILELSEDEALVLFELLGGYGESDDGRTLVISHAAERNALWALEATLERQLIAPFEENYKDQLKAGRARVEAHGGGW